MVFNVTQRSPMSGCAAMRNGNKPSVPHSAHAPVTDNLDHLCSDITFNMVSLYVM